MLNIVIPMAGAGSRFAKDDRYSDPKPLIRINNSPMIKIVIDNLKPVREHRFIFICQKNHIRTYNLKDKLEKWSKGCIIVEIDELTEGAACTVLKAKSYINNKDELMIANSDQFIDADINKYLDEINKHQLDGLIMTMKANSSKWSYVGFKNNSVNKVVEKKVISDEATVGIYNFLHGVDFVTTAEEMINNNDRVNNEFYVAPVYNYLIKQKKSIGIYNVGSVGSGMYGLGTPDDLDLFMRERINEDYFS